MADRRRSAGAAQHPSNHPAGMGDAALDSPGANLLAAPPPGARLGVSDPFMCHEGQVADRRRSAGAAQHSAGAGDAALDSPRGDAAARRPPGYGPVTSDLLTCHETLEDDMTAEAAIATLLTWGVSGAWS